MSSTKRVPVPPSAQRAPGASPKRPAAASILKPDVPDYLRHAEAQGRALQLFEKQQQKWDRAQHQLTQASGKPDGASISATTHLFREKVEEMGKIDVAVPPAARSHASNSWEMSLRGGASATRYEPVGSSFPYPLYCPIRAPDQVKTDNPAFMHVLYPPTTTQKVNNAAMHAKPVTDSQYFRGRQQEFQGQISKKFSHFSEREFFDVRGEPAPRTTEPIDEEASAAGPVQFIPMAAKDGTAGGSDPSSQGGTHAITIRNLLAAQQQQQQDHKSVSTSAGIQPFQKKDGTQQQQQQQLAPPSPATVGPMLVLSTNNLSFTTTTVQEIKQAVVTLENTGSTAIFYNWAPLPSAPALLVQNGAIGGMEPTQQGRESQTPTTSISPAPSAPSAVANSGAGTASAFPPSPSTQMPSPFSLSNPVTGSILPGAHKMFCFSFRAPAPGVFVQHMELVTVPSGRERIVVTLRGVATAPDADAVSCDAIEQQLRSMVAASAASETIRSDIIHNVVENAFAVSDAEAKVREREAELEAERTAHLVLRKQRSEKWRAANSALAKPLDSSATAAAPAVSAAHTHEPEVTSGRSAVSSSSAAAAAATAEKERAELQQEQFCSAPAVPLPFNEPAYAALELIRQRCSEFRSEFESSLHPPRKSKAELAAIAAAEKEAAAQSKKKDGASTPRGRKGDDEDAVPPPDRVAQLVGALPAEWDGSLRGLHEDINTVRTAPARHAVTEAVTAVHKALSALQDHNANKQRQQQNSSAPAASSSINSFAEDETSSLSNLVWLAEGRTWIGNALDKFDRAAALSAARVEGKTTCVSKGINMFGAPAKKGAGGGPADKNAAPAHGIGADITAIAASVKPGRGGATAAAQQAAASSAQASASKQPTCGATPEEGEAEGRALMLTAVKELLLGAVEGMINSHDRDMAAIEAVTVLPLSSLIVDSAEKVVNARDMEAEPVLDLNTKKRK